MAQILTTVQIIDLYDIALLLNYERAATEPRFRHTKLREVVQNEDFKTIRMLTHEWATTGNKQKTGFVFDRLPPHSPEDDDDPSAPPDLPSTMLAPRDPHWAAQPDLSYLTPFQWETFYWQARNHDACYKSVTLIQHFFALFPPNTQVRVRTEKGREYLVSASLRVIMEMKLVRPRGVTLSCVLPGNMSYITGGEEVMDHAVVGFPNPSAKAGKEEEAGTILDLASLQFGDVGRGCGGKSLFLLESMDAYGARLNKFAEGNTFDDAKVSMAIGGSPWDGWLKRVAERVKDRWVKREGWCGHCGKPGELKRCSGCKDAFYCDNLHQAAAWGYHKRWCKK
jgi:hypothetical protein